MERLPLIIVLPFSTQVGAFTDCRLAFQHFVLILQATVTALEVVDAMADSVDVEEAMVVIQEAAADIRKATQQLSRSSLEKVGEQNQEILRSIENITNRLSTLEEAVTVSTQTSRRSRRSSRQPEISLYTRVREFQQTLTIATKLHCNCKLYACNFQSLHREWLGLFIVT